MLRSRTIRNAGSRRIGKFKKAELLI